MKKHDFVKVHVFTCVKDSSHLTHVSGNARALLQSTTMYCVELLV